MHADDLGLGRMHAVVCGNVSIPFKKTPNFLQGVDLRDRTLGIWLMWTIRAMQVCLSLFIIPHHFLIYGQWRNFSLWENIPPLSPLPALCSTSSIYIYTALGLSGNDMWLWWRKLYIKTHCLLLRLRTCCPFKAVRNRDWEPLPLHSFFSSCIPALTTASPP